MNSIEVEVLSNTDIETSMMIEGLPGVGHVGKLAAEYLIDEFESQLARRVYSEHFPPQVTINESGVASLVCAEFYTVDIEGTDLLVLVGDHQATHPRGHYRLTDTYLDVAESFSVSEIIALGGVPTGELTDEHHVLGAVSDKTLREEYEDFGVEFRANEPAGGIVGTSGLLLGLGQRREIPVVCLMGETSGYLVDPKNAQSILKILESTMGFSVDYSSLEKRAEEMETVIRKLQEMHEQAPTQPSDEDLRYFG